MSVARGRKKFLFTVHLLRLKEWRSNSFSRMENVWRRTGAYFGRFPDNTFLTKNIDIVSSQTHMVNFVTRRVCDR